MITQQEYQQRRNQLASTLPEGAIAIIPAAEEIYRNGDTHYRFRQSSNFYYLTGFNEPEAVLLIVAGEKNASYLFNRTRNPAMELWTGKRLGQEDAPDVLGVKQALPIESFAEKLKEFVTGKTSIYYTLGAYPAIDTIILATLNSIKSQIRRGIKSPESLCDLEPLISEMRLFKSAAEIALMRRANEISIAAHKRAMQTCSQLNYEYELEAELIYEFARQGCRSVAYDPIVGAGGNACVLHYNDNNQTLKKGDLVLIDAGGEYQNYAADITRTFPVNGQFSAPQKAIYELVLKAQKAGIALIKPGVPWVMIQQTMIHILTEGLVALGVLKGNVQDLITQEAYKAFYMHNSGHWLGLDVHDSGRYKLNNEWRLFEPGMVLTVEPGLYISPSKQVDECWWNIGVRIEDDILVTSDGHDNLTQDLPVEVADIEALMRG